MAITSTRPFLTFCPCSSEVWAKGSLSSPTRSLLILRWGAKLFFINVYTGLLKWWRIHSFQLETKVATGLLVSLQWSVENEAPKYKSQPPLSFGLLLNPELSTSVLERGPPADSPKVFPTSLFISVYYYSCASKQEQFYNSL